MDDLLIKTEPPPVKMMAMNARVVHEEDAPATEAAQPVSNQAHTLNQQGRLSSNPREIALKAGG